MGLAEAIPSFHPTDLTGMVQEYFERLVQSGTVQALASNTQRSALLCWVFGLCFFCLEWISGAGVRQYRWRSFVHDVGFWVMNGSGIFRLTGSVVLLTLLQRVFPAAQFHPLVYLPSWAQYVIFLLAFDFISYWVHRWQHFSPFLWAFHTTHHTQHELSFATTARSHPVEQWLAGILIFLPIAVFLGAQPLAWLPVALAQQFLFAMTHSRLNWRFGRLGRLLVSPVFHSVHHSLRPEHHDRNFSAIFSFWDHLFGTAVEEAERVHECGLGAIQMPTFWSLLWKPFRLAYRSLSMGRVH